MASLQFPDGSPFTTGVARYQRQAAGSSGDNIRIFVVVEVGGIQLEAMLDTGAPWLVCSPEVGEAILDRAADLRETVTLKIRGLRYEGRLYRVPIRLPADDGDGLDLEVSAFVPTGTDDMWSDLPPLVLGWFCCLERARIAISPGVVAEEENLFYFGQLEPEF